MSRLHGYLLGAVEGLTVLGPAGPHLVGVILAWVERRRLKLANPAALRGQLARHPNLGIGIRHINDDVGRSVRSRDYRRGGPVGRNRTVIIVRRVPVRVIGV